MDDSPSDQWLGYTEQRNDWASADGSDAAGHHSDWPYYQAPPGELNALLDLCQYPYGTGLLIVDDIDRVLLLLAEPFRANSNDFHEDNLYAAAWHDDLKSLQDRGLIEGLSWGSYDEWSYQKYSNLLHGLPPGTAVGWKDAGGNFIPLQPPPAPPFSDLDDEFFEPDKGWPIIGPGPTHVRVTAEGWTRTEKFLQDSLTLSPALCRVSKLLELGYADTAVREAAVTLEAMLKRRLGTDAFGKQLISTVNARLEQVEVDLSHRRIVLTRLRTVFKFIRNKFAHNTYPRLPMVEAEALCWRIASLHDSPLWEKL